MSNANTATNYAMLSQPMQGLSEEEIGRTRDGAIRNLQARGYQVLNTLFAPDELPGPLGGQIPIRFLSKSIATMSRCSAVYFCKGWTNARECRIEHAVATEYGIPILYEDDEEMIGYV